MIVGDATMSVVGRLFAVIATSESDARTDAVALATALGMVLASGNLGPPSGFIADADAAYEFALQLNLARSRPAGEG